MVYSMWLAASVLLYASSHRQDNTYNVFITLVVEHWLEREIAQWIHHEELIWRPITPWANALTTELHLAPCNGWESGTGMFRRTAKNAEQQRQKDGNVLFIDRTLCLPLYPPLLNTPVSSLAFIPAYLLQLLNCFLWIGVWLCNILYGEISMSRSIGSLSCTCI